MLGSIRDTALKRNFPFRRIGVYEVGFCANDVDDDVFVVYVLLEFEKPLEVASSGSFCLRWRRKKKREKNNPENEDRTEEEGRVKGTEEKAYHECIARKDASEVMS